MSAARIHDLIRLGPNERAVFVHNTPAPETIARLIASLANTEGGVIVFGVRGRSIVGLRDRQAALRSVAQAAQQVTPALLLEPQIIEADGQELLVLQTPRGLDAPYTTADGRILVRRGRHTVAADAQQAAELAQRALSSAALVSLPPGASPTGSLPPGAPPTGRLQPKSAAPSVDLEHILLKLERLIIANAELARKLDEANSWQSRLLDQVIGAGVGIIVSVVLFYVFGIG
jgi:hypothetical protein